MDIEKLREEIKKADKDIADAFVRRMEASKGIAEYKKAHGISVEDTNQEQVVLERDSAFIEDPEIRSYFLPFLKSAISASKSLQSSMMSGQHFSGSG